MAKLVLGRCSFHVIVMIYSMCIPHDVFSSWLPRWYQSQLYVNEVEPEQVLDGFKRNGKMGLPLAFSREVDGKMPSHALPRWPAGAKKKNPRM